MFLQTRMGRSPPIFGPCLLWPNDWMDQDATWHEGRPQPRRLCVRWGPSPLRTKGVEPSPQFSAHFYCGQMAGCIKMPLGMDVGLSPGNFVLDGDPVPLPKKGAEPPIFGACLLWPNDWMDQDDTWHGSRPQPRWLCFRRGHSPLPKKGMEPPPQFSVHFYCGQTAGCIKMPLGTEVGLSRGDVLFDGDPASSSKRGRSPPIFGPCLLRPNGCMDQDATWYGDRPRPIHCVRWGPSSPSQKGAEPLPQFSSHVYCGQTAGWIKMALGMEVVQPTLC